MSPAYTIWLMIRMRLIRQRNLLAHTMFRFKKKKARDGNGGKRSSLWILTLVTVLIMSFSFTLMSNNAVLNMQCQLDAASACGQVDKDGQYVAQLSVAAQELAAAPFSPTLMQGLTMEVSILFFIAVLLMGGRELTQPDWDLEWLVTMPVPRSTLLWGRVLERSVGSPASWFAFLPAFGAIAWHSGHTWSAFPLALLCALALLPLAALVQTLIDTGLRMVLPASQLRNLQAVIGLLNLPMVYFVMSLSMPRANSFTMDWARAFPAWMEWLPPGLVLQAVQARDPGQLAVCVGWLLLESVLLMWAGMALLRYQLRNGVVNSGMRESARDGAKRRQPAAVSVRRSLLSQLLSPVQRRELRLLSRDRNFMFQTMILPVIIVGSQMLFNGKLNSLSELGDHHTLAAAIAFGMGVYVLMLSAFQTLNNEGQVLWLLYTLPRSIENVLKEKAQLWGTLTLAYPAIVLAVSLWYTAHLDWQMLVLALTVLLGIPIYSVIAVSLGVFACDPQSVDVRTRVRPTYVYLYMLLASFYTWSIYSSQWSQKLVVTVLIASLALALWQKARDALPYLLDPASAPPARVSTADGLIAATAFFILQGLIMLAFGELALHSITIAFGIAGLTVYALMRLVYWRNKTAGVPVILRGMVLGRSLRAAAVAAAVACAAGLSYLTLIQHTALWAEAHKAAAAATMPGARGWIVLLTVVAAPLCEEFIFRGLIYGGLRRSMPTWQAMVMSAAVFAVVHPPMSILPVFVVGLCTAWTYERSKTLLAPMLVHAAYNAFIVSMQLAP